MTPHLTVNTASTTSFPQRDRGDTSVSLLLEPRVRDLEARGLWVLGLGCLDFGSGFLSLGFRSKVLSLGFGVSGL